MEKINFSEELGGFDRRMVEARWRDRWKSFILLLAREKKKRWKNNSAIVFPSLESSRLPTRFDDFIEQTGRTAFTSHILYDGSKNRCYR